LNIRIPNQLLNFRTVTEVQDFFTCTEIDADRFILLFETCNCFSEICSGDLINLDPAAIGGNIVPLGTKYTWLSPSANPGGSLLSSVALSNQDSFIASLTNTTNAVATATYTVTPVLTSGCSNSAQFTIVVTVNPKATIGTLTTTI
jgi:hypothetical protein